MKVLRKGITELKDVTITHVSYVKRGANKKTFLLAKSEAGEPDVEFDVKVLMKDDAEKRLLYGVVYEPGAVDAHGDTMNAEEIEKMAHEFMAHYRAIDKEHNLIAGAGSVVESYIVPADSIIGNTTVKAGSWMLVTKASQEIWDDYLNGEITGYSMYGIARQSIAKTEPETPDVGWIQKMMEKAGIIKGFQETLDSEIERIKTSPTFI
ncbi:MAG: XkdF-like putative serine protease domain-containing protein, partial [Methanolobus sp.]|nr:XkdF-like putative serine protease domain-containing protein [Methanolobus sp.]